MADIRKMRVEDENGIDVGRNRGGRAGGWKWLFGTTEMRRDGEERNLCRDKFINSDSQVIK